MNIDNIATLEEAKEAILQMISGEGGSCPCCRQKVRAWRKSICSTSAADLDTACESIQGSPVALRHVLRSAQRPQFLTACIMGFN